MVLAVPAAAGEGTDGEIVGAFQMQTAIVRGHRWSIPRASNPAVAVAAVAAVGIAGGQLGELGL
jgi:hypothetical protein